MAYNHGREERKWRIWKEAEEKILRKCGVDEDTIEKIRIGRGSIKLSWRECG
ncbi:RNA polymerase subunit sigma-70 [bacterium D16-51]|nr:RNA polymerase subunit sigma-70 [bacterium D16-59]RKI53680.1 RNA polymerase subunit sigma-70 [bacterium D16-51]